jgi:GT2 family glycosyltransferase
VVPEARTPVERAIAHARFSVLGVGGGVYTLGERPQLTETVQCGVYRREALVKAGAFDPALPYGEDEEANHRLRAEGWRILMNPAMRFAYQVRPSIQTLFRQYFRYGRARVAVVRKHPAFFRLKHAIPAALVVTLTASLPLAAALRAPLAALLPWVLYLATIVAGGVILALRHRFPRPDLIVASLAALHLGYGLGTLRGLLDTPRRPSR